MKSFIGVIGLLTIAQWIFVGLLYGFLTVQDKASAETMTKLHDFPVIGGYFPKVHIPTPEEKEQTYGDELRKRLVDARRQWNLPASYNEAEFVKLMDDVRERGERLKNDTRRLEKLKLEIRSMEEELNGREDKIHKEKKDISIRERQLLKEEQESKLQKDSQNIKISAQERVHNKKMANWLNVMSPEAAVKKLLTMPKNATPEEMDEVYSDAAKLLGLMEEEQAARVIELIGEIEWVKIEQAKRALPIEAKKKK